MVENKRGRVVGLHGAIILTLLVSPVVALANDDGGAKVGAYALEPVSVTARKQLEALEAVPVSVTALKPSRADDAAPATESNTGLSRTVANLSFVDSGGQNGNLFTIRGVGAFAPLSPDDTSVVTYSDGVPRSVYGAPPSMLDVERVEVLRGPQGTLFGRNTQGGAIQVIHRPADFQQSLSMDAQAGSHGYGLGEVVANTPLSDNLAARIAARYSTMDGNVRNIETGGREGNTEVRAGRASLTWLPGDTTLVTLSAFQDRRESDAPRFVWREDPGYPRTALDPSGDIHWRDRGAVFKVRHDFESMTLTSLTSFQDNDSVQPMDLTDALIYSAMTGQPRSVYENAFADYARIHFTEKTFQQELRLSSRAGAPVTWVAGINGYGSRFRNNTTATASPAAFNFVATQNGTQSNHIDTDSVALFGEATWPIGDRLKGTLGGRVTHEEKSARYRFTGNGNPAVVDRFEDHSDLSETFFTGRAGLSYQWNRNWMSYASISRGVVSAGFPVTSVNTPGGKPEEPYPTSRSWAYEMGFKSLLLADRLRFTGALFYNDVSNGHLIAYDPAALIFTPASLDYDTRGAELEAEARLTRRWSLAAGAGYTRAVLKDIPADTTTGASSGNRVPNVPLWNGHLRLGYSTPMSLGRFAGEFTGHIEWQYQGKRSAEVKEGEDLGGYGLFNGRVGWRYNHWEFYAFGWNLADKEYVVAGRAWTDTVHSVRVGRPRIVGVGVAMDL